MSFTITRQVSINFPLKFNIPSDKSISHRALILLSLARGTGTITNLLESEDVLATIGILRSLGVSIDKNNRVYCVSGNNGKFCQPTEPLDCGNSGTTIRLILGLCAPHAITCCFIGDESLSKRPMRRVTQWLEHLGVTYRDDANFCPLFQEIGAEIPEFDIEISLPSAQVKSALLLAAVQSNGGWVRGGGNSRNHTETMLASMGANVRCELNGDVYVSSAKLSTVDIHVPGDFSSAAFFIAAGLLLSNSEIHLPNIGLNPTRIGFLKVLSDMNASIEIVKLRFEGGERVGDVVVRTSSLIGTVVDQGLVPTMIDEFPILALIATQANGTTRIRGAQDLRKKESDRISTTCGLIRQLGGSIIEYEDGWMIEGPQNLQSGVIDPEFDHRIAMTAAIASCVTTGSVSVLHPEVVDSSFPSFWTLLSKMCHVQEDCHTKKNS